MLSHHVLNNFIGFYITRHQDVIKLYFAVIKHFRDQLMLLKLIFC